jgi:hypothetical protein
MGISTGVYDSDGTKNQRYEGKIGKSGARVKPGILDGTAWWRAGKIIHCPWIMDN